MMRDGVAGFCIRDSFSPQKNGGKAAWGMSERLQVAQTAETVRTL